MDLWLRDQVSMHSGSNDVALNCLWIDGWWFQGFRVQGLWICFLDVWIYLWVFCFRVFGLQIILRVQDFIGSSVYGSIAFWLCGFSIYGFRDFRIYGFRDLGMSCLWLQGFRFCGFIYFRFYDFGVQGLGLWGFRVSGLRDLQFYGFHDLRFRALNVYCFICFLSLGVC